MDELTQTWENVGTLATVKTPEERGGPAAWAYGSRDALDLSPEQVVQMIPLRSGRTYDPATVRKAEADSKDMSGPMWRALTALYPRLAREKGITLDPIPLLPGAGEAQSADLTVLVQALADQTAMLTELVGELQTGRIADGMERAALMKALARVLDLRDTPAGAERDIRAGARL